MQFKFWFGIKIFHTFLQTLNGLLTLRYPTKEVIATWHSKRRSCHIYTNLEWKYDRASPGSTSYERESEFLQEANLVNEATETVIKHYSLLRLKMHMFPAGAW